MLKPIISKLQSIFIQGNVDHTHGIAHALLVLKHGNLAIQQSLTPISKPIEKLITLACLLHDADDKKYFPSHSHYDNVQRILREQQVPEEEITSVISMIKVVSYSKNGDTIDQSHPQWFYYARYADRLEAIGMKGLLRAYHYALLTKSPAVLPETIKPQSKAQLLEQCSGREQAYIKNGGNSRSFIDHIFDKLIHIRLPEYITNPYLIRKFEEEQQKIIDFVLSHAKTDYRLVVAEMEKLEKQA